MIDTFGTGTIPEDQIEAAVRQAVDLRPYAIRQRLKLSSPFFSKVACYGHFGSNAAEMPWEATDLKL